MDLSDVMKTVIAGLNSSPAPTAPDAPPRDRAKGLYEDICTHIRQVRCVGRKPPIEDGCLRASALSKVLAATFKISEMKTRGEFDVAFTERPVVGELMTYDLGHAVHQLWRDEYLGPMRRLWGTWRCVRCATAIVGVLPAVCAGCSGDSGYFKFEESLYIDKELRVRGHPDGLLAEPESKGPPEILLEIKSASSDSWDKLTGPEEDHLDQTHVYMHGSKLRQVVFIYVDKGKQTKWKWFDGKLRPVGEPRFKVFRAGFDEKRWTNIKKGLTEFWAVYDKLEVA